MKDKRTELETQSTELKELRSEAGMNRREFADYFGIPIRTIEDWEGCKRKMPDYLRRLMSYRIYFDLLNKKQMDEENKKQKGNVDIITDAEGNKIVLINDIRFKGKQNINWDEVESYLKEYIGNCYEIIETSDKIYVGNDFPSEFKGSEDTKRLKGANAKAKANATQKIPQLLAYAINKRWSENYKQKHKSDAKYGWYRYTSRFALPIYSEQGELLRYNIFRIEMLIRSASDNKLYLYDMVNVKKETEYPA